MKTNLVEEIKSRGYWRINFQPLSSDVKILTLADIRSTVESCSVEIRGWDYPHIPRRDDDDTGIEYKDNFIQGWIDWANHKEFWRMYKSEQYLHYLSIREDWLGKGGSPEDSSQVSGSNIVYEGGFIYVKGLNWQICEVFEFLSRLKDKGIYQNGVMVSIKLMNTAKRQLMVSDDQVPFMFPKKTSASELVFEMVYDLNQISFVRENAAQATKDFYDKFGWNPSDDIIKSYQDEFFNLRFGGRG